MKEMILYKQHRNLEKGNTYYIEKINNTVRDFQDNFIDKEELDNLLMVIQKEIVKSCNLSNQQLISLTKLINRERFTYLYLSDPCEFS
jgi:wyosine [tRNA(Phe)-imidazoG37] synthetase (radical SAM superfamily)